MAMAPTSTRSTKVVVEIRNFLDRRERHKIRNRKSQLDFRVKIHKLIIASLKHTQSEKIPYPGGVVPH
jgi:hypothetical protein